MQKIKLLLSLGSSTTYGMDLKKPKAVELAFDEYRMQNCYTGLLAKKLNAEKFHIEARPGYCSASLYRVLVSSITQQNTPPEDLFVMIAMPPITPTEVYLNKNHSYHKIFATEKTVDKVLVDAENIPKYSDTILTDFHKFFYDNTFDLSYGLEQYFLNLISMQNFLLHHNIKHVFFSSSPLIPFYVDSKSSEIELEQMGDLKFNKNLVLEYINKKSLSKFLNLKNFYEFNNNSILEECKLKNNFKTGRTGHILEEGHKHWADLLWSFING